uniref:Uncharacterized protein n=1 Tax=Populus alba TaxID=43335 RepID=A0A4U5QGB0_POPAL|nr:hypothetical protein D5086_0000091500 [Populus alba]
MRQLCKMLDNKSYSSTGCVVTSNKQTKYLIGNIDLLHGFMHCPSSSAVVSIWDSISCVGGALFSARSIFLCFMIFRSSLCTTFDALTPRLKGVQGKSIENKNLFPAAPQNTAVGSQNNEVLKTLDENFAILSNMNFSG